jgi:hypothetical protein
MAKEVLSWAKNHGYSGKLKQVWWTARPGVLAGAVGVEVDSRKNPTDILVCWTKGPANGFLGISAKSTKGNDDIGFKNPGLGTIEKSLSLNLKKIVSEAEQNIIKTFKLSPSSSVRKGQIRANKKTQEATQLVGSNVLREIRDVMFKKLSTYNAEKLRAYVMSDWMDSNSGLYPPYIKVTGYGNKEPYFAKVDNPLENEKLTYLNKPGLKVEKLGNDAIGVSGSGKRLLKMRAKFESEKLASSVKFSGEPWK